MFVQRIRALKKLDQNLEERKKLENGINNRLGAALLLLNNTIHEQGDIYDLRSDERKVIHLIFYPKFIYCVGGNY